MPTFSLLVVSAILFFLIVVMPVLLTRVPYVPTSRKRLDVIFPYLEEKTSFPNVTFVDIGCGYGNVLREASRRGCKEVIGIEASPVHALVAFVRTRFFHSPVKIIFGNFFRLPLPQAKVYYLFLTPPIVPRVLHRLAEEAPNGAMIIVLGDKSAHRESTDVLTPDGPHGVKIYCYNVARVLSS